MKNTDAENFTMLPPDEYARFLEKFKSAKTTDSCFTPPAVYREVLSWLVEQFPELKDAPVVRPFYPGGDYINETYPEGCVVVDNPPFSIFSQIVRHYNDRGIRFFLFAPSLTLFSSSSSCFLPLCADIIYENGAKVSTSFVTNLRSDLRIWTPCDLYQRVTAASAASVPKKAKPIVRHSAYIITAAMFGKFVQRGIDLSVPCDECKRVTKEYGRDLFGGGFLLSRRLMEKRLEAEKRLEEAPPAEYADDVRRLSGEKIPTLFDV